MAKFVFVSGDDEFRVNQRAKVLFSKAAESCDDEFSVETIEGMAQTVDDVANAVTRTLQACQTLSLFGGKKAIWLRSVNFLSDKRPGNTEGGKAEVEKLQAALEHLDPETVTLIISAWPVDKRRKEFKWFQKYAEYIEIKTDPKDLIPQVESECLELGVRIDTNAAQMLVEKVGGNSRLIHEELNKLSTYLANQHPNLITEALVTELVPNFGEGDFFEVTEAFYSLDLNWTLDALRRHFFIHDEARPVIASLQNRNRLLIQLRALIDAKQIRISQRGIDKTAFDQAWSRYSIYFAGSEEKSSFNVFTQNAWYLGNKVAGNADRLTIKKLIDIQEALLEAFEGILKHPKEQHKVLSAMAIQCLASFNTQRSR